MAVLNSFPGYDHATEAGAGFGFTSGVEVTMPVGRSERTASGRRVESNYKEIDELWDDSDDVVRLLYQSQENDVTRLAAMCFNVI